MYFDETDNTAATERGSDDVFSKPIRAGKRTYFFDVKATKGNDYYITITESKRKMDFGGRATYDKHKIFLYKEDFEKFMNGLQQAIDFIGHEQGTTSEAHYQPATATEEMPSQSEEIKIDIDF